MSGHSKWKQIKHKKAATDAKRGNLFSKLTKAITIAAREGQIPEMNTRLRLAIQRAKEVNMPSENIERAIAKADPEKADTALFEVTYEAYGPGGSALLIEGITDNKNRAVAEIKHILTERGGKLAEAGSVAWMFEKKGVILLSSADSPSLKNPETELFLIDLGAEEIVGDQEGVTLIVSREARGSVLEKLRGAHMAIQESYEAFVPKVTTAVAGGVEETTEALIEALEAHDDVQNVWSNIG